MAATGNVRSVTPERWQEVKAVVARALELPLVEREAYVDVACRDDTELRSEVDSLLVAAEGSDSFPIARRAIVATAEQSMLETALHIMLYFCLGPFYRVS